jgi:hypothetical protein
MKAEDPIIVSFVKVKPTQLELLFSLPTSIPTIISKDLP